MQRLVLLVLALATPSLALESPQELLALKLKTQMLTQSVGTMTGEGVAWHASWRAGDFVAGAQQTGDTAYLDAAVTYLDSLIGRLHTSPDGYRGWVGPYIYDSDVIGDVHIGDAILVNHMLQFALYVRDLPDEPRARFASKAQAYRELGEHIIEKWDVRGTWYESGHTGGYVSWDHYLTADSLGAFQRRSEVRNSGLSLPFNKQQSMALVHLRLHQLGGSDEHRQRAQLIFQTTRSRLSAFGDTFTWNYWEPLTPDDVASVDPPRLRHWVATHPYRDYQAGEVSEFVEAWESGLVFTDADIKRLVQTNLAMWNGDTQDPEWTNSDHRVNRAAVADWSPSDPSAHGYPRSAGRLWHALTRFDATLAALGGTTASNTTFTRTEGAVVEPFGGPLPQVTYLNLGCALPPAVERGESTYLVSKSRAPGQLRIDLTDAHGTVVDVLFRGDVPGGIDGIEGVTIRPWQAMVPPGRYRVRWTIDVGEHTEHRDYPLVVR